MCNTWSPPPKKKRCNHARRLEHWSPAGVPSARHSQPDTMGQRELERGVNGLDTTRFVRARLPVGPCSTRPLPISLPWEKGKPGTSPGLSVYATVERGDFVVFHVCRTERSWGLGASRRRLHAASRLSWYRVVQSRLVALRC